MSCFCDSQLMIRIGVIVSSDVVDSFVQNSFLGFEYDVMNMVSGVVFEFDRLMFQNVLFYDRIMSSSVVDVSFGSVIGISRQMIFCYVDVLLMCLVFRMFFGILLKYVKVIYIVIGRLISVQMIMSFDIVLSRFVFFYSRQIGISMLIDGIILVDSIYSSIFCVWWFGKNVIVYVVGIVNSSEIIVMLVEISIEFYVNVKQLLCVNILWKLLSVGMKNSDDVYVCCLVLNVVIVIQKIGKNSKSVISYVSVLGSVCCMRLNVVGVCWFEKVRLFIFCIFFLGCV